MNTRTIRRIATLLLFCLAACGATFAKGSRGGSVHVRGYTRKNGTYVAPHYRSAPNSTKYDNWSTKGNVNPYTGKPGTESPTPSARSSSDVYVQGYTRADGTYVSGYWRSAPDGDPSNNFSTKGNINPYTGAEGHKNPDGESIPAGPDKVWAPGTSNSSGVYTPGSYVDAPKPVEQPVIVKTPEATPAPLVLSKEETDKAYRRSITAQEKCIIIKSGGTLMYKDMAGKTQLAHKAVVAEGELVTVLTTYGGVDFLKVRTSDGRVGWIAWSTDGTPNLL